MLKLVLPCCLFKAAVLVCFAAVCLSSGSVQAQRTSERLIIGHTFPLDHPVHRSMEWASEEIGRRTFGRYHLEVHPAAQLGFSRKLLEAVESGKTAFALLPSAVLGNWFEPVVAMNAPFAFPDRQRFEGHVQGDLFRTQMEPLQYKQGLVVIAATYMGQRHFLANRAIVTPDDLKGMRLRVPAGLGSKALSIVGVVPVSISSAEVYQALRVGVVEGVDTTVEGVYRGRLYETLSTLSLTGHATESLFTLGSANVLNSLSDKDRHAIDMLFREAAERAGRDMRALEERRRGELGLELVHPDRERLRDALQGAYFDVAGQAVRDVYDQIRAQW